MTALGALARLAPIRVQNLALRWREERRLARVAAVRCDVGTLAVLDAERVRQLLSNPAVDVEWAAVGPQIERFGITAAAGGVNPGDRRALYYLVRGFRPERVLEVGTHIGASTVHIAAALRANGNGDARHPELVTVDIEDVNDPHRRPWERYGSRLAPREMVDRLGDSVATRFVVRPSLEFLAQGGEAFDFIFLDGDHSAATVYRELPAALGRLRLGGVILLHDYFPDGRPLWRGDAVIAGPWLGVERLRREGARLEIVPLGALPWPTKHGSTVTSLALVGRVP
ncbi:MAG TPA: class I SAM-dependent methyltransferase [Gemmatimonadales bacterium]|nr:class I SAM-dependent methyltransferase [Gemmatimonadales bacterium]